MSEAGWALLGVVVGTLGTGIFNYVLQARQFAHNKEMFDLQNRSADKVKEILTEMLNHRTYTDRSFEALRRPIGGYTDDELRLFLHDVGARRAEREDGSEWWYLTSRADERRQKKNA